MTFSRVDECRSCGGTSVFPVLDLGEQPLANAYRRPDDTTEEPRYPLALMCCASCSLVQLTGTVPPERLFTGYPYYSSYSTTMVEAMRELAGRTTSSLGLSGRSLVVDIGSNDGYLLRHYAGSGIPVLGVEPAENLAAAALTVGVPTVTGYFGSALAGRLVAERGRADVIHANNVMAHVPQINDFVAGLATLLAEDGTAFVESPYLGHLLAATEFDTVYHEHVFYYSLASFEALVGAHGLTVVDVEPLTVHGGSIRYTVRHAGTPPGRSVDRLRARETAEGGWGPERFDGFAGRVRRMKDATLELLRSLKADGASIAAYGAAAKGTVLLNHLGIDSGLVGVVYDRNVAKQGSLMPGTAIPITDPAHLAEDEVSHLLLLVWNLAEEIIHQEAAFRERGGAFVIPGPEPRVLDPVR